MRIPILTIILIVAFVLSACLSVAIHQGESRFNGYENVAYAFAVAAIISALTGV